MAAARRRRLSTAAAAATLTLLAGPAAHAQAAEDAPATITLTSITPVVDGSDGRATIRGRVINTTDEPIARPTVAAVPAIPGTVDGSREGVADWAKGDTAVDPAVVAPFDTDRTATIAPGRSASFTLSIEGSELLPGRSWGAAPVSIQTGSTAVHTFVGIHRAKEYETLGVLWGVPVTLPPDHHLFAAPGERRTQAWEDAVGPGSDLAETTSTPPGPGDLWLLDPGLVTPPDPTLDAGLPTGERDLRADRAEALLSTLDPERTAVLPEGDADVAAATTSASARTLVSPRVSAGTETARELGARGDVVWPADGVLATDRLEALDALYGRPTTVIAPRTALPTPTGATDALRTSVDGSPLVLTDPELSALAGSVRTGADAVLATQRLVADSAAVLGEAPGTARTLAIVPERGSPLRPEAYAQLRDSLADIPWTSPAQLPGETPAAPTQGVTLPATAGHDQAGPDDGGPPRPILTEGRSRRMLEDIEARTSFASVRSDGRTWSRAVAAAQEQLTSARWRTARWQFRQLDSRVHRDVTLAQRDLTVASGDVNFFADTGRLQITVENHTDVELQHLEVRLTPQSGVLRIDTQPEPVTIGPRSRHTVTVQATALAGGRVPIRVDVTDPQGRTLSSPATLRARVSPTGNWIYWGIGGAAVALLSFGTWRSVRRPRTTPTKGTTA